MKKCLLVIAGALAAPILAIADEMTEAQKANLSTTIDLAKGKESWLDKLTLTPRVLQASDANSAASLGLGYVFKAKPLLRDLTSEVVIGPGTPTTKQLAFELEASGLYAAKAEANQSKLIELSSGGSWLWIGELGPVGTVFSKTAFGAAYSREQGNGTRESKWELSQGLGKFFPSLNYSQVLSRVSLANVSPKVDTARKAVIGTELRDYRRWEGEFVLIVPVQKGLLQKIELSHREFREVSAPVAVRSAGLHSFRLSSVYFGLDKGLFVAFSRGGVPADRKNSSVLQLGWSTNIE